MASYATRCRTAPGFFQRLMHTTRRASSTHHNVHEWRYRFPCLTNSACMLSTRILSRLRTHDLKLSPSKTRLGVTDLDSLGPSTSSAGLHPDSKARAMTELPMPTNICPLRSMFGELSYYRKILTGCSKRSALLLSYSQRCRVLFATDTEAIVRGILKRLPKTWYYVVEVGM